jgi:hypothetical protein
LLDLPLKEKFKNLSAAYSLKALFEFFLDDSLIKAKFKNLPATSPQNAWFDFAERLPVKIQIQKPNFKKFASRQKLKFLKF